MWRNYFLVAIRNLKRHRFFSFINIFGLAISMSVCLGIIMLVADQLTYDRYNTKRERIFRINTRYTNADGSAAGNDYSTSPQPLAETLLKDYTGIEKAVRIRRGFGNPWIEFEQDVSIPLAGFFADPEMLDVFEYELKYGDPRTALKEPFSVVVTEKAAEKLFKQENPVGEVIKVGDLGEYKVTGVIKENDQKSHIVFEALASYSTINSLAATGVLSSIDMDWGDWTSGWVYILLEEGKSEREIANHLNAISRKERPQRFSAGDDHRYQFFLQNLTAITPGPFINNPIGPFMPRVFVYFFGGLALIVMLTSCFNYTNLSIARSLTRAREIGVRKVNGAHRFQIFFQFLSESVLLAFFSLGAALLLLFLVKPFLLNLKFAQVLKWDLEGNVYVYLVFGLFTLIAGMMAGLFPSIVLSRFQPVKVLKNAGSMKIFSRMGLRKSLLVVQFTLSLVFILSVIVLYNQLNLFVKADYGFELASKINVRLNRTALEPLKHELLQQRNIVSVAPASHIPAAGTSYGDGFKVNLHDADGGVSMNYFYVDASYLENLNLELIAGENFKTNAGETSKTQMIINEEAVRKFQFKSPHDALGAYIYAEYDSSRFEVIGVVKDYNHQVLIQRIGPMALRYDPSRFNLVQVKYSGSYEEAAKSVEQAWAKVNPTQKLDYKSFEEEVKIFYNTVFSDFVSVVGVIALLAIVIACLGLLGMATYTTETRLKEISIRKVLGSSSEALVYLVSKSFIKLLVVAIVIAVPLAWFINNMWLELIAYRTPFSWTVIAIGVGTVVLLGVLTIGSQTVKAAFTNPVNSLKNE